MAETNDMGRTRAGPSEETPVTMSFSLRCDPRMKEEVEVAVKKVATLFGARDFRMGPVRVGPWGPSDDTLQRVLPLVFERVVAERGGQCFRVCKSWRLEMKEIGFCYTTHQLCSTLSQGGKLPHLAQNAVERLGANTGERELWLDTNSFLQRSWGSNKFRRGRPPGLHEWLQAASQEPEGSFLSGGAASTAKILGWEMVQWVGKPEGRYPVVCTMDAHNSLVSSTVYSPDGKRVVSGSWGWLAKVWDVATGAEVSSFAGCVEIVERKGRCAVVSRVLCFGSGLRGTGVLQVCEMVGHTDNVNSVAISKHGLLIVSGSVDKLVKIWKADTGAEVSMFVGFR